MEDNTDKNGGRLENAEEETLTDDEEMSSTARVGRLGWHKKMLGPIQCTRESFIRTFSILTLLTGLPSPVFKCGNKPGVVGTWPMGWPLSRHLEH